MRDLRSKICVIKEIRFFSPKRQPTTRSAAMACMHNCFLLVVSRCEVRSFSVLFAVNDSIQGYWEIFMSMTMAGVWQRLICKISKNGTGSNDLYAWSTESINLPFINSVFDMVQGYGPDNVQPKWGVVRPNSCLGCLFYRYVTLSLIQLINKVKRYTNCSISCYFVLTFSLLFTCNINHIKN